MKASSPESDLYDIGAVCRLTGLSAPNLRVWEKRYGIVEPARNASNRRQYTAEHIRRLTLVKTLSEHGHKLSSLASLTTADLEKRILEETRLAPDTGPEECRAVVIGEEFLGILQGREQLIPGVRIKARMHQLPQSIDSVTEIVDGVDLLLISTPTLFPESVASIQKVIRLSGALRAVVAYRFAPAETLVTLTRSLPHISTVRSPVEFAELQLICRAEVHAITRKDGNRKSSTLPPESREEGPSTSRRYSDSDLARIARLSTSIDCECPHHLAELLGTLNAFADYSEQCENRNDEDAQMHAYLHRATCQARGIMESALSELIRFESIDLEKDGLAEG